jgi:hypothetical protein
MLTRTLIALACTAALGGCAIVVVPDTGETSLHTAWGNSVQGNGQVTVEARQVGAARALDVSGSITVEARAGQADRLEVEGDSNLLPMVRTEMRGETLHIYIDGNTRATTPLRVRYATAHLERVAHSGSGHLDLQGLDGSVLKLNSSGSGTTVLGGQVNSFDADLSGSGRVDANRLQARAAHLALSGSGQLIARVSDDLVASSSGSGQVTVYGNPARRTVEGHHVAVLN